MTVTPSSVRPLSAPSVMVSSVVTGTEKRVTSCGAAVVFVAVVLPLAERKAPSCDWTKNIGAWEGGGVTGLTVGYLVGIGVVGLKVG